MNPILAYAIEHEVEARAIIIHRYRILGADLDDVIQDIYERIYVRAPDQVKNTSGYWFRVVLNAAVGFLRCQARDNKRTGRLWAHQGPDPGPEETLLNKEGVTEAWATATPCQKRAIAHSLEQDGHGLHVNDRVNLHRLRRRLRQRAEATA